jgi:hypothetical protein
MLNLIIEPNLKKFNKLRNDLNNENNLIEFLDLYVDNYYDILVEQFSATEIIKKTDKISENKEKIMLTLLTIFFINNH